MAESAGIGCKVYWHERDRGLTYLKIPSNKKVKFSSLYPSRLGRVSNVFFNKTVYGKAGNNRLKKKKFPSVRGIAMNAVDHPNGGRTNTKSPYRNPWGFPAKKGR